MDSGNSSSMQSSSGGGGGDQEEYDSRADQSFSAFFNQNNNNNTTTTVSSNMAGSAQLDSLIANYFNNTGWSSPDQTPLWSAPKPPDGSSTPIPPQPQPQPQLQEPVFFTNPLDHSQQQNINTSRPSCLVPTDKKNGLMPTRNPKKRSRVSRRAPTTVLTTDTSNFRAMVQEFTGNPSTPFNGLSSSSSPFPTRSRFDLFGSSSSSSLPLRPFPHKLINHHQYLPPPSDYHLLNINTQNTTNPFLNHNQTQTNPLMDQSSLSLRRSNDFGRVETNFEGLQNIMGSSSSSSRTMTTQPTLGIVHGDKTNENVHHNDMLRSINGEDQATLRRSDGSGSVVRNEGMVELSWISSSD